MCRDFSAILVTWGLRSYGGEPGLIGLEPTLEEHIENLVAVFRQVKRVLRKDGVVFLNYGDAYARNGGEQGGSNREMLHMEGKQRRMTKIPDGAGLKPKDLMMMPARVALALQAAGWWVRSEIIWAKPNPMPESVTDRPTSSHEKIFLLSKSARYFYDSVAVRVPSITGDTRRPYGSKGAWAMDGRPESQQHGGEQRKISKQRSHARTHEGFRDKWDAMPKEEQQAGGANLRNVWHIATHAYSEAHFATFPPKLVEPCIKAGTSERGCCVECGAPWARVAKAQGGTIGHSWHDHSVDMEQGQRAKYGGGVGNADLGKGKYRIDTINWQPTCECKADVRPCRVLDPFGGSGTVGLVAERLGRDSILVELNGEYVSMAEERIVSDNPLFTRVIRR